MSVDPRVSDADCWWCLGEGTTFGATARARDCPFCEGTGSGDHGVTV